MAADSVHTPSASTNVGKRTTEESGRAGLPAVRYLHEFARLDEFAHAAQEEFERSEKTAKRFSGADLVNWLSKRLNCQPDEALHMARILQLYGFIIIVDKHCTGPPPIRDHPSPCAQFQTEPLWPKHGHTLTDFDYASHLYRIKKSRHGILEQYEQEALLRLERELFDQWPEVVQRSNAEKAKLKRLSMVERYTEYARERAFWQAHCGPGRVMDLSILHYKKESIALVLQAERRRQQHLKEEKKDNKQTGSQQQIIKGEEEVEKERLVPEALSAATLQARAEEDEETRLERQLSFLQRAVVRPRHRVSRAAEMCRNYVTNRHSADPFMSAVQPGNPWVCGDETLWTVENSISVESRESRPSNRQYLLWGLDISELLHDARGSNVFNGFLEKEYSAENIQFWMECNKFASTRQSQMKTKAQTIYADYLASNAPRQVNVPQKILTETREFLRNNVNRYMFESAQHHIYELMRKDSYQRFIMSEDYTNQLPSPPQQRRLFKNFRNRTPVLPRGSPTSFSSSGLVSARTAQSLSHFPGLPPSDPPPQVTTEEALAFGERLTAPKLTQHISRSPDPSASSTRPDSALTTDSDPVAARKDSNNSRCGKLFVTIQTPDGEVLDSSSQDIDSSVNRLDPSFASGNRRASSTSSGSCSPSVFHRVGNFLGLTTQGSGNRSRSGSHASDDSAAVSGSDPQSGAVTPAASPAPVPSAIRGIGSEEARQWMVALQYPQGIPDDIL